MPSSNAEMIADLKQKGVLKTDRIIKAFTAVDRRNFLQVEQYAHAYDDTALPILSGQTISQPYTVAFMFELLLPQKGDRVLDVGSGSGWTTAILAEIVGPEGFVTGTEILPDLVEFGRTNLKKYKFTNVEILQAQKDQLGVPEKQFDKILVSASAMELPRELFRQLKIGGIMVIPIGESIVRIEKTKENELKKQEYPGFIFVPLI